MYHSRNVKKTNWPKILDSSLSLKKYLCAARRHQAEAALTSTGSKSCLQSDKPIKSEITSLHSKKSARATELMLDKSWRLATDPVNLCASIQKGTNKIDVAKTMKKPKSKLKDRLEAKKQNELMPRPKYKLENMTRVGQDREFIGDAKQTKKKFLDKKGIPNHRLYSPRRKSSRKSIDYSVIKFLDANARLQDTLQTPLDECYSRSMSKHKRVPGVKGGRSASKRSVPLCDRPSHIYPLSKQILDRQEQLFQLPEYQDQYALKLKSEMPTLQFVPGTEPYVVPSKRQLQRVKKSKRYCGNFYYN